MRTLSILRIAEMALCAALACGIVPVQAQNTTAAVGGKVTSMDGRTVAGAAVTVRHNESGSVTNAVSDSEGRYIARGLRVGGPYTITVTKDGVTQTIDNVFLTLAETVTVDARLGDRPKETIVVTGTSLSDKSVSYTHLTLPTNREV